MDNLSKKQEFIYRVKIIRRAAFEKNWYLKRNTRESQKFNLFIKATVKINKYYKRKTSLNF
jgi:hypothetical protein